ncbi:MAG: phage major capsid protein [Chryseobacterium sp.]|nr:MAG: phage major capsid protein [Chryseobacterium sp.]
MKKNFVPRVAVMGPGSASGSMFFRAKLNSDGGGGGNASPSVKELLEGIEAKLEKSLGAKAVDAAKAELKALSDKIAALEGKDNAAELKEIKDAALALKTQVDALDVKLQKGGKGNSEDHPVLAAVKGLDIKKLQSGESGFQEVVVKAATPMTVGSVNNPTSPYIGSVEVVSGISREPQGDLNILQDADTSGTNAATIVWINKYGTEGNAEFIGEGDLKPLRSFKVKAETSNAKKVAVRFNVSTESLEDLDFLASEINSDGIDAVVRKTNDALLNSTGAGDEPKGITKYAGGYVLTTIKGEDPDNYGALRAGAAQVRSLKFRPNRGYINPIDAANMDLKKGANGQYVLPPFTTADGRKIGSISLVETDEIPVGFFLIGDMKRFKIRPYKGIQVKAGYNGEDFSENMMTIIVEQRLHAYVNSIDTGAFVYDSFATVKAAILIAQG